MVVVSRVVGGVQGVGVPVAVPPLHPPLPRVVNITVFQDGFSGFGFGGVRHGLQVVLCTCG